MNNTLRFKFTEYCKLLFFNTNNRTRYEEKTLLSWFSLLDEIEANNFQSIADRLRLFDNKNREQLTNFLKLLPKESNNIFIHVPNKAYLTEIQKEQIKVINEATGKSVIAIYRSGIEGIPGLSDEKRIFIDNEFDLKEIYEEVKQK